VQNLIGLRSASGGHSGLRRNLQNVGLASSFVQP